MKINNILNQIVERLKAADPYKTVLFGSYAKDTATPDSDIDLMVILDNYDVSKTSSEKLNQKVEIRKILRDINYKYAMDILVYSGAEFKNLKDQGSFFIDELERTGRIIYEKWN